MRYKVKLSFIYSDTVYVEADNKKKAILLALEESQEEYELFYDADISEVEEI